ncbi:alkaline phosphatase family protein [Sediminibacterium sp.]|uniref:alkaline phosphatase family protein n=1 Tax=Sediminibacterium sp. TaxID=1917865 RepID=UPI003F708541
MRQIIFLILLSFYCTTNTNAQQKTPKIVFVIADGIPAELIEKSSKPNLSKIITSGFYKRAFVGGIKNTYNQTPTISAPGYNNLITGTWSNKHQVVDNNIKNPNYQYYTIFRFLKEAHPHKTTAVFSTWQDNRTKLVGDGLKETGGFKVDYSFDGYELDTLQFPHDKQANYTHLIDEKVIAKADSTIRTDAPDLSWIYLQHTDDIGHRYGNSRQLEKAIDYLDVQMGKIWEAIQYREKNFKENWLIIITTDHGRDAATGKNHGGQSDAERTTWIIANLKNTNTYFKNNTPAIVDLLPTMARFIPINLPKANEYELDGVPLTGPVSLSNASVEKKEDSLIIRWKAYEKKNPVKIFISKTNLFKIGQMDHYELLANTAVDKERFAFKIDTEKAFLKLVLVGKKNTINTQWFNLASPK